MKRTESVASLAFVLNSDQEPNVLRLSRGVINIGSAGSISLRCVKHRSSFHFFRNVLQIAKWGGFRLLTHPILFPALGNFPSSFLLSHPAKY